MKKQLTHTLLALCASLTLYACRNEEQIKTHIQANQTLLQKKQDELSDLNYKVTNNSLKVGTNEYDSTIGRDFNARAGMLQVTIDSLKAQTDSLQQLNGQ